MRALIATTAVLVAALGAAVALAAESRTVSLVSTGPDGGDGPFEASFAGVSPDGQRVAIWTEEALVASDTNGTWDLYQRAAEATLQITAGPAGSGAPDGDLGAIFDDGRILFATDASLLTADDDAAIDLYERSAAGEVALLSTGPGAAAEVEEDVSYGGASTDGSRVFFTTAQPLLAADTNAVTDVYERTAGTTTLVSRAAAAGTDEAEFSGISADGSVVFFTTASQLLPEDTDSVGDVYERSGGQTALVSTGPEPGPALEAGFAESSADGSRAFFSTPQSLLAADPDLSWDVYERSGGATSLVSIGSAGNDAFLSGLSADGSRAFYRTAAQVLPADTDSVHDVYERANGVTTLLTLGSGGGNGPQEAGLEAVSTDGARALLGTNESLLAADADTARDLYLRAGGELTLLTAGTPTPSSFESASAALDRIFITTESAMVAADTDAGRDVYEIAAGTPRLLSTGPDGGGGPIEAFFGGASENGAEAFFETDESLLATDTDVVGDVYRSTLLVSPDPPAEPPDAPVGLPIGADPAAKPRCAGKPATIVGTAKRDVLRGTDKRDVIFAGAGNDKVVGRGGNDLVCAGAGKDTVLGGGGNDRILGQGGADRLYGGAGRDAILGGGGRDLCRGQGGKPGAVGQCER